MTKNLPLVGRYATVDIPSLNISHLTARIDTGAYGGALHAKIFGVEEYEGKRVLRFSVVDDTHPEVQDEIHTTEHFTEKKIRSAFGEAGMRYKIPVTLLINGVSVETIIGISDRSSMRTPMILGRAALAGKFLVDVSRKF